MNIKNSVQRDPGQPEKGAIFHAVVECIRREGFTPIELLDAPSVKVPVKALAGNLTVFVHVGESTGKVVFRARLDEVTVPVGRSVTVRNMISLVNGHVDGKFTLGFDGILYFETFTLVDAAVLRALKSEHMRARLFRPIFLETVLTADQYTASIIAVIEGVDAIDLTQFDEMGLYRIDDIDDIDDIDNESDGMQP